MWTAMWLCSALLLCLSLTPCLTEPRRSHHKRGAVVLRQEVATTDGILVGELVTRDTGNYYAFRGVPYAAPPVGRHRFKNPQPVRPWERRDALREGPKCAQIALPSLRHEGQEDCLYLNVYVPTNGEHGVNLGLLPVLPVMVYFHGGGFQYGSGTAAETGPEFLVHHDVILVTLNYRLGAIGFLNLDNDDVPGNMGLKDQRAALQWVRRNIAQFGGDPDNVTIFGNSAGSASVHYHSIVKASEGLFSGAIMQSGNALAGFAYQETNLEMARRLAQQLTGTKAAPETPSSDPHKMAEVFRKANASEILAATLRMIQADPQLQLGFPPFCPSPERREQRSQEKFLPQDPESLMIQPQVRAVPTIAGLTGEEGYFAYTFGGLDRQPALVGALAQNPSLLLPPNLIPSEDTASLLGLPRRNVSQEQAQRFGDALKDKYDLASGNGAAIIPLLGDLFTGIATHRLVDLRIKTRTSEEALCAPLYLYHFLEDGHYNWGKISFNISAEGPTHTDELGYLMHVTSPRDLRQSIGGHSTSSKALCLLTKLWTDFAKTKVPHAFWPPAEDSAQTASYIKIVSNTLDKAQGLGGARLVLWGDIFDEFRKTTSSTI